MDWGIPPPLDADWFADSNYPSADVIKVEVDFDEGVLDGLAFVHIFSENLSQPVNTEMPSANQRDGDGGDDSTVQFARNRRLRDNVRKSVESWNGLATVKALAHFVAEGWSGLGPKPSLEEIQTVLDRGVRDGDYLLESGRYRIVERTTEPAPDYREDGLTVSPHSRSVLTGVDADTLEYGSEVAASEEIRAPDPLLSGAMGERIDEFRVEATPVVLSMCANEPVRSEEDIDTPRCSSETAAPEPIDPVESTMPRMEMKTEAPDFEAVVADVMEAYGSAMYERDIKVEEYDTGVDAGVLAPACDSGDHVIEAAEPVLHEAHVKAEEGVNGEVGFAEVCETSESVLSGLNLQAEQHISQLTTSKAVDASEPFASGANFAAEKCDNGVAATEEQDDVDADLNGEGDEQSKSDDDGEAAGNGALERKAADVLDKLYDCSALCDKAGRSLHELCEAYMDRAEADGVLEIRAGSLQDDPRYTLHPDIQPTDFTDLPQVPERFKRNLETEWPEIVIEDDCTMPTSNDSEETCETGHPENEEEVSGSSAERKLRRRLVKEINGTLRVSNGKAGCHFSAIFKRVAQVDGRNRRVLKEETHSLLSEGILWGLYSKARGGKYRFNKVCITNLAKAAGLEVRRPDSKQSSHSLEGPHPTAEQSGARTRDRPPKTFVLENLWDPNSVDSPSKKVINHWNWMIVNALREAKGDKGRTLPQVACHLDKLFGKVRPYRGWKDLNVRDVMQSFAMRAKAGRLIQKISNCLSVNPVYGLHPSVEPGAFPPRPPFSVPVAKKRKSENQEQPKKKKKIRRHILHTESVMDGSEIPDRESLEPGEIADSPDIVENGNHELHQDFPQGWVDLPEMSQKESAKEFKDEGIQCAFGVANPMPHDTIAANASNKDGEPQLWEDVVEKAVKVLEDTGSCTTEAVFGYVVAATSKDAPPTKALMIFGETDVRQLLCAGEENGCYEAVMDRWRYVEENCRKMPSSSGMGEIHTGSLRGGFMQDQSVQTREEARGHDESAQVFSTDPEPWPVGQPFFWGRSQAADSSSRPPGFFKRNLIHWSNAMPH